MPRRFAYDRRRFLAAGGTMLALPLFESLLPRQAAAAAVAPRPKRLVFLAFGWGITYESWAPAMDDVGPAATLPKGVAALARHKADFTIIQNLTNKRNDAGHWGSTLWLTNADRYAVPGSTFTNTVSCDQLAAEVLGTDTRYASVQLGCQNAADGSGHGPGLSLAWDRRGKPIAGWDTPFDAYARLFGDDGESVEQKRRLLADERSALDAVLADAKSLDRRLGREDSDKLAEYLQGVRDIEKRLTKEERWIGVEKPKGAVEPPAKNASGVDEINLMYDLLVAALRTDQTRVITYRQPVESLLKSINAPVAAHDMSHYSPGPQQETSEARDRKQSELLAGLFDRMKAVKEPDGRSLFDDTIVVYGSNLRQWHSLDNCPTILAGGGGAIRHSTHLVMPQKNTPLANLWLTLLRRVGVEADSFADSTSEIGEILPS